MLGRHHESAEKLAGQAAMALQSGNRALALTLYARAADNELRAFESVAEDKLRTRSILAVSTASLLYKARLWERAEKFIFKCLAIDELHSWLERDLRDILEVVWDERTVAEEQKAHYAGDGFTVAMRGGLIGVGTAPVDQFLHTFDGFRNLFYRVTEWVAGLPFRKRGLPPEQIRELLKARTSQPMTGSYRFRVRLIEPEQMNLFEGASAQPQQIAETLFNFVTHARNGDNEKLAALVKDEQYRSTMLKLLRNIAPDGKKMNELQLIREGGESGVSVSIFYDTKAQITQSLRVAAPPETKQETILGVLRALDLDGRWIEITPVGAEERARFHADMILDDVVGPMVNHNVRVSGIQQSHGRRVFEDIELEEGGSSA